METIDAMGRLVELDRPPLRVVSLVPSETSSVADLVGVERLVGRTDYCIEPAGAIDTIPSVGGTKGFDVETIKALRPDLVLANKEENSRPQVQALIEAGLPVHVSFPCTVEESLEYLDTLCRLLGVRSEAAAPLEACRKAVQIASSAPRGMPVPVFVPIWKDPWMTFDGGAYASDMLELCGAHNVFSDRSRLYPLAADLGKIKPWNGERIGQRDTRYPRIRLHEVLDRGAAAVLLPDEPYAFGDGDAAELAALETPHPLVVELVDGKDLFWYGTRAAGAILRLTDRIARLRAACFGT
ncbi:MAG: helical backbone metal receptor [Myxococcales bacterium]|nr:helical backbone metal receptor [Myxococcales bacterium]